MKSGTKVALGVGAVVTAVFIALYLYGHATAKALKENV